jgi:thiamine-monophosphate kinase
MCGERRAVSDVDEFEWIEKALRPLAAGAPEAFDLADDAAAIPARPGFDLIVSKDAIVDGVHFLPGDPLDLVARKLLRVNLSDLAAKGAEPYGYFLAVSWPAAFGWAKRGSFVDGLREDQHRFGLKLLGGDTTTTPGPLTASATILGWAPAGRMVRRSGAKAREVVFVSGTIGDAFLGLKAARHELDGLGVADRAWLLDRYRLPQPRLELRETLRARASAAADVSDGLLADAGHIAAASGVCIEIDLDRLPLSQAASAWLAAQADQTAARLALATGGDDYEIVCAGEGPDAGAGLTPVGRVVDGAGLRTMAAGRILDVARAGYVHR